MKSFKFYLQEACYLLLLTIVFANISCADEVLQEKKERLIQSFLITYENDSIYGGDNYYSNGLQILMTTKDFYDNEENKFLPKMLNPENKQFYNYSFGIGQKIYTPSDIDIKELVPDDRPYAGYLYLFLDKNIRHKSSTDTFGISIGITGPASLAEDVQTNVHEWIGSPIPRGWDNQLSNEFLFMFSWLKSIKLRDTKPYTFDWNIIPKIGINLGTPFTNSSTSVEFRFGWNLDDDLITNRIKTSSQGLRENSKYEGLKNISYYFFIEAEGDLVLYNTFLDGNISGYKPDITKNIFCYNFTTGLTIRVSNFYIKYSSIFLSKEFKEQNDPQVIFSINAGFLF